jgi:hypothetical protein
MTVPNPGSDLAPAPLYLTLTTGREVPLRYGMLSVLRLEETFGSLNAMRVAFNAAAAGEGPIVGPTLGILCAGLLEEHDGNGGRLSNLETLAPLLDQDLIQEYAAVAGQALLRAFPKAAASAGEAPGEATAPTLPAVTSPGPSGTTSAPSSSDAATTSSGA